MITMLAMVLVIKMNMEIAAVCNGIVIRKFRMIL